jgi:serine/threonine protein kinase
MQYVDGQLLRDRMSGLSQKQALEIGIQIAEGLAAAHEKGIVHRDIKPENIMVRKDGIVQIMDFGLAKLKGVSRLTKEGSTVGTAGYMSPEQIQGQDADHRSDIFSLGVLLYEMLTGQLPFKGVHETAIAYEIVNVDPVPMSSVSSNIDPDLDLLILECLEKNPWERTQSIAQVALDLKRYRRESGRQKMSRITSVRSVQQAKADGFPATRRTEETLQNSGQSANAVLKWVPWAVSLILLLSLTGLAIMHFGEADHPNLPSINSSILPPSGYTFDNSIGGHMALSPDGTMLAFVAADSVGRTVLFVRPLDSPNARQLPETYGAQFPFWSPDNKFIGFFTPGKLKKVLASGAPPVVLCEAQNGRGGSWNTGGVIIFAPNFDFVGLHRVSASGGQSTPVTHVDSTRNETNHRWPHFLPDGNHFIYTTQSSARSAEYSGAMYVSALDGSTDKLLIKISSNMAYNNGYLLYVRQQSVVAQPLDLSGFELRGDAIPIVDKVEYSGDKSRAVFAISSNGVLVFQSPGNSGGLASVHDGSGKKILDIPGHTVLNGARFSPDGTKIALDSPEPETSYSDVWLFDLDRHNSSRVTFDPSSEWNPIWSPDGRKVAYASDRRGSGMLYEKNADGTEAERALLKMKSFNAPLDWAPDGKYIIEQTINDSSGMDLMVIPLGQQEKPFLFVNTRFSEDNARFSPDGRWVVYQSDESGKTEIYVRPFPTGGGKWQISNSGGERPIWSSEGKRIFYNRSGGMLMSVEVHVAGTSFSSGSPTKVFEIPRRAIFDVSKDGSKFLVAAIAAGPTSLPVTIVTNWDKNLKNN